MARALAPPQPAPIPRGALLERCPPAFELPRAHRSNPVTALEASRLVRRLCRRASTFRVFRASSAEDRRVAPQAAQPGATRRRFRDSFAGVPLIEEEVMPT